MTASTQSKNIPGDYKGKLPTQPSGVFPPGTTTPIELTNYKIDLEYISSVGVGGAGAGKISISDFEFTAALGSAYMPFYQQLLQTASFPAVAIYITNSQNVVTKRYAFTTCKLSDLQTTSTEGGDVHDFSMVCANIAVTEWKINPDGTMTSNSFSYDILRNVIS